MYGVTNEGFSLKRLDNILEEVKTAVISKFPDALLEDEQIEGQYIGITSDILSLIWEVLQDVYHASHIQFAENASLDHLLALNKIVRRPATKSKLPNVIITGTIGYTVPAGFRVKSSSNESLVWETITPVVIGSSGTVTTDLYCTVTGANNLQVSTIDIIATPLNDVTSVDNPNSTIIGTNVETDTEVLTRRDNEIANSRGGSHAGLYNAINALNINEELRLIDYIKIISNRTDAIDVGSRPPHSFEAVVSDAATYTSISTGDGSITTGTSTLTIVGYDATGIINKTDIIAVFSDYNTFAKEKFTVVNIELVGLDTVIELNANYKGSNSGSADTWLVEGKDKDIADAIWGGQCAGIPSYGTANITTQDVEGDDQIVSFSHPAPIDIYLELTLTVSSALTSDEETDIKEKITTWGNSLGIGQDVIIVGYNCLISQLDNPKIRDAVVNIDTVYPPVAGDSNIIISDGTTQEVQYSYWSVSNITIL